MRSKTMQVHLTEVDVAIVGYGPTGQTLAALLGQAGWRVGVYERWPSLYTLPRACVIDHEAMRILQSVGVAERFAPLTVPTSGDYVWLNAEGRTLYHFRYAREGLSGWPARQLMYQPDLEVELDRRVRALPNIDLQQGWEAVGVESRAEGITRLPPWRPVAACGHAGWWGLTAPTASSARPLTWTSPTWAFAPTGSWSTSGRTIPRGCSTCPKRARSATPVARSR
jgi:glycine/D-amino acid oxidase-like deaminating enzyme